MYRCDVMWYDQMRMIWIPVAVFPIPIFENKKRTVFLRFWLFAATAVVVVVADSMCINSWFVYKYEPHTNIQFSRWLEFALTIKLYSNTKNIPTIFPIKFISNIQFSQSFFEYFGKFESPFNLAKKIFFRKKKRCDYLSILLKFVFWKKWNSEVFYCWNLKMFLLYKKDE